ncbi:aldolase/citrate lyase family protein [Virgisporangium ochraceum]
MEGSGRLSAEVSVELDRLLGPVDAVLAATYPGQPRGRKPVHTVYVPADRVVPSLTAAWGRAAREALSAHPPAPFDADLLPRVRAKLDREPIEDLRVDFEDGYGLRPDDEEDAAVDRAVAALVAGPLPPFVGLRCKSLEASTRARAVRTLDRFLDVLLSAAELPDGFVVTLPKVSAVEQVTAMTLLCERLESAYRLDAGRLRFELQIETPATVLGADGVTTVVCTLHAARGRCAGLHYGTYDYSASLGIAAAQQSMDHPAADHAKAVMQVAAAGTGVPVSDGSTNVLPVGDTEQVHAAWQLHARLVRRSLERGFYQGWDLHPAQLPTRYGATYAFFRKGLSAAVARLDAYLARRVEGVADEPTTALALAGYLLRGLHCGALDDDEVPFDRSTLEAQ